MPSTLFNIWNLLRDYKRVIRNNNDMSIVYILYQVIMFVFTITGPGMIFILLISNLGTVLDIQPFHSLIINLIPLLMFMIVCIVGKPDIQISFATILTIIYAMVMVATPIVMAIEIVEDTIASTNIVSLSLVFGPIFIAGLFHPRVMI